MDIVPAAGTIADQEDTMALRQSAAMPVVIAFALTPFVTMVEFFGVTWNYFFSVIDLLFGRGPWLGTVTHLKLFVFSPMMLAFAAVKLAIVIAVVRYLLRRGMAPLPTVFLIIVALQVLVFAGAYAASRGTMHLL